MLELSTSDSAYMECQTGKIGRALIVPNLLDDAPVHTVAIRHSGITMKSRIPPRRQGFAACHCGS
jgi:hypothetical protein